MKNGTRVVVNQQYINSIITGVPLNVISLCRRHKRHTKGY